LALIDAARARGVDVQADQHAYAAASSSLGIRFPAWALEGGQIAISGRLNDPGSWARIKSEMRTMLAERGLQDLSSAVIATYAPDTSLQGLSLKQVAVKLKSSDAADAQLEAARDLMLGGGASMVYHVMAEEDVVRILRSPWVAIASDSGVLVPGEGTPHPRGYGNNARVLGEYVRSRRVLGLEEAVRKMTSLPASILGLTDRGAIKPGQWADLVIFDPATVADKATFEDPFQYPVGIDTVIVNGTVVLDEGKHTNARPGKVLRRPTSRASDSQSR
jgi:N-acyl-D-amino-acid deacylase